MNGLLKFHKHSDRQYRNLRDRKTYGTGKRPTGQEDLRDRKTYGTGKRPTGQENLRDRNLQETAGKSSKTRQGVSSISKF